MVSSAPPFLPSPPRQARLEALLERTAELCGQRNAIDGELVDIAAEIDREEMWGGTGCRSLSALLAWKLGATPRNAQMIAAVAARIEQFPRCVDALREGRLSLDQVAVLAEGAADGSDDHYAELAQSATVTQLRTAVSLEPTPEPLPEPDDDDEPAGDPEPDPVRSISKTSDDRSTTWRITLPHDEAAVFDAALGSHRDALVADFRAEHPDGDNPARFPSAVDGFLRLIHAGWDTEVAARPHGQRTTVVVHLDVESRLAALHVGPLLSDADRHYLTCDATCEVWFERDGRPIGAGRATRTVGRRLRRALEHRDRCCVVPGCGATRGLHAHHIVHWEDGGPTELWNLVLVCPFHHWAHHRRLITITGPADELVVSDARGHAMTSASLARPPTTPPPDVPPYKGPTGERADWWWYQPYEPHPPPSIN